MSPTVSADQFIGLDDNLIRFNTASSKQVDAIIKQATINQDKTFIVFKDSDNADYAFGISAAFKMLLESSGGKVLEEITYSGTQAITESEILSAFETDSDKIQGVMLASDAVNAAIIINSIKKAGYDVNIYTTMWTNTPELFNMTGSNLDGVHMINLMNVDSKAEAYLSFAEKFESYYGEKPPFSAISSYETMMTLPDAIKETKSTNPQKIKNYITQTKDFKGLQYDFEIDAYGDCSREYILGVVKNGTFVAIE